MSTEVRDRVLILEEWQECHAAGWWTRHGHPVEGNPIPYTFEACLDVWRRRAKRWEWEKRAGKWRAFVTGKRSTAVSVDDTGVAVDDIWRLLGCVLEKTGAI